MIPSTRRLVTTLRPTLRYSFSSLSATNRHTLLVPSVGLYPLALCRTYAVKRGASSRPVKVKEHEPIHKESAVSNPAQEAPISSQYQQAQTPFDYQSQYGGQTSSQVIDNSVSLQAFLKRSMVTTGVGLGVTALATAAFIQMPFVWAHPYISMGVGMVGAIGSLVGMQMKQPQYVQEGEIVKAVNSDLRKGLFATFLVAEGLSLAPMIGMVALKSPMAIPVAGALAVGTMAGMCAYALRQPQGSLLKWGPALSVGIFGLIGASVVNMFIGSSIMMYATSAIGIGIFSAFTAYDTHVAIQDHNEGRPDHLLTAANFFLNAINLFLDYLRLLRGFFED